MTREESKQTIESLCSGLSPEAIQDFLSRMDEDYFATFSPEDIATHIRMSCSLNAEHRINVRVISKSVDEFDVIIVGFDYLSEFSIFCGLLSAFGLDIRAGNIYSFAKRDSQRTSAKIVDVFNVALKPGESFDQTKQREFENELQNLAQLLAGGSVNEARERLNRFLVERIERMDEPLAGLVSDIKLDFDNGSSADWTVMDARSEDTFAFLYAVSNALSMRGIYIHKVKIRSDGSEAADRFFIADRWGRKIENGEEQDRLRKAVAMIKQFTRFLPEAADPAKAMRHFDQFLDKVAEEEFSDRILSFFSQTEGMNMLAHLLGSSDFLWDDFLRMHFTELLPVLQDVTRDSAGVMNRELFGRQLTALLNEASNFDEKKRLLNRFKDTQVFRIDAKHLLQPGVTLIDFSNALTDLAETIFDQASRICFEEIGGGFDGRFAVFGLGKFGGREMGYASDVELLFVHDGPSEPFERLAHRIVEIVETRGKGIFHIDLRLRPYGDAGSWSTPFDEFRKYYSSEGQAMPFERQALIKLRWFSGDETLGRAVEAHRDGFTYSGAAPDVDNARHLRRRQMRELVKPGQLNVKYSAGGIVDIEYGVQHLQLIHGHTHPELRVTNTLEALDQLGRLQIISGADHTAMRDAYLFLRNLIDALRIVRGDASDLILPEEASDEFKSLARRLGYRHKDRRQAAAMLARDIDKVMKRYQRL